MEQYQNIVLGIGSAIGLSVGLMVWRRCCRPRLPPADTPLPPFPQQTQTYPQPSAPPSQYYTVVHPTAPQFGTQV